MTSTRSATRTERGRGREQNQDDYLCDDELGLYVVCDGMGGTRGGAIASSLAVDTIVASITRAVSGFAAPDAEHIDLQALLEEALREANDAIFDRARGELGLHGMGTTATAVWIRHGRASMAHVGDSRLYLVRGGVASQVSTDHSLAAELAAEGRRVPTGARHLLTRALGAFRLVTVDALTFPVAAGDRLVLATDGAFYGDHAIDPAARSLGTATEVADTLVSEGWRLGEDDATVVVVDVGEAEAAGEDDVFARVLEVLAGHAIFSGLTEAQRVRLLHAGSVRSFPRGATLVGSGATLDRCWVVVDGELETRVDAELTGRIGTGRSIGWSRLMRALPAAAEVRARTPVRVFELSRDAFRRLALRRPSIGLAVTSSLFERARTLKRDLA